MRALHTIFSITAILAAVVCLLPHNEAEAETSIRSQPVEAILRLIWRSEFSAATDSCHSLLEDEPDNPIGHFLLGMVFYSITNQYRTDRYVDSVTMYLDKAIELSQGESEAPDHSAESYFVLGSAYGCRALYRSMHGGWWGAFRDGHHSCDNLEKAYAGDSTLTDALSGIGAYHYWKSVKSKKVAWLPFISDKREQGLTEIARGIEAGGLMSPNARKAMLPIYCYEKQFTQALALADSLKADSLFDTNCQLHAIRALIEQQSWDEAAARLQMVEANWSASKFADSCGFSELQFLKAQILIGRGNGIEATEILRKLASLEGECKNSAYFRDTLAKTKSLSK